MDSLHRNVSSGPWTIHDVDGEVCDELVESQASNNEVSNKAAYVEDAKYVDRQVRQKTCTSTDMYRGNLWPY